MSLLLTFLLSAAPAQGPGLSAPHFPAGDAAIGPSAGQEAAPALAHGSGVSLLVWSDRRSALGTALGGPIFSAGFAQSEDDVLGQRLDAQGQLLDAVPFPIAAGAGRQVEPRVAFNGQHFLVAWLADAQVFARRVSMTGALLDATPILVDASADTFSLAANGTSWLLVTESYSAGAGGLFGFRIAADGTLLDPAGVLVAPQQWYLYFGSRLSAAAGEWLVAYDDLTAGWIGQRLDATLAPIGTPYALPGRDFAAAAASYLVAWEDAAHRLLVSRMQPDGTLLDPAGILISASWFWTQDGPRVSWDGTRWWVVFPDFAGGLSLARVSAAGQNLDPGGFALVSAAQDPEQAALVGRVGGGVQAAWLEYRPEGLGAMHLQTQGVAGPANFGPPVAASTGAPAQVRPDFAAHDDGVAMAALSLTGETARVTVSLLDRFGNPLTPEPIEVHSGPSARTRSPAVAWNGSVFLVTWSDVSTGIWGRRLAADGTLLDPAPLALLPGEECDVAALGTNFLVVGAYSGLIYSNRSIYAMRVDGATGAPLDPAALYVGGPFATAPAVAAVGGRWIVAWQNHWSSNSTIADLALCFVAADGTRSGAVGVENQGYAPALAVSAGEALVAYRWGSIGTPYADVKAQRVRADGSFIGTPILVSAGSWKESEPAACWTGSEWWVAWEDQRHALGLGDGRASAYAARLDANGVLLDPTGVLLAQGTDGVAQLALADSAGQALVAWSEIRREAPLANWRVGLRTGGAWQDFGFALAGASGAPRLHAAGALILGGTAEFQLSGAPGLTSGRIFAGSARVDLPLRGGTLVPRRDFIFPCLTDAAGRASLLVPIGAALPPGFTIFVQAWLLDPTAPQGFAASNAVGAVAP